MIASYLVFFGTFEISNTLILYLYKKATKGQSREKQSLPLH